jgi:DNA-binding protein H-NS
MAYQSFEIAQLRARQDELDKKLAEARERETRQVLIEIVQKMREYGISLNELMGRKPGAEAGVAAVAGMAADPDEPRAKYRDPVSGATWSGRGRAPAWIAGKDRDAYLVDKHEATRAMVQAALFPEQH